MFLEQEQYYALGMDALVTACACNKNRIMLWAWMLWPPYALGTRTEFSRTEFWFGHGCSGHRMLLEHEQNSGTRTESYGLGMDALVTVCSWNTNGIMVCAWILWSPHALGTRTEVWFGHGCSGHRILLEHSSNQRMLLGYDAGTNAVVTACLRDDLYEGVGMNAVAIG